MTPPKNLLRPKWVAHPPGTEQETKQVQIELRELVRQLDEDEHVRFAHSAYAVCQTPQGEHMKNLGTFPGPPGEGDLDYSLGHYSNGRVAVKADSHIYGPWGTISTNVIEVALEENEFVLNHDSQPDSIAAYMSTGLFEDTGKKVHYGFVRDQPVWRLKPGKTDE